MKLFSTLLFITLSACNATPASEAESENAIAERATEIRSQADGDIAKQIEEIEAAANAEATDLGQSLVNRQ